MGRRHYALQASPCPGGSAASTQGSHTRSAPTCGSLLLCQELRCCNQWLAEVVFPGSCHEWRHNERLFGLCDGTSPAVCCIRAASRPTAQPPHQPAMPPRWPTPCRTSSRSTTPPCRAWTRGWAAPARPSSPTRSPTPPSPSRRAPLWSEWTSGSGLVGVGVGGRSGILLQCTERRMAAPGQAAAGRNKQEAWSGSRSDACFTPAFRFAELGPPPIPYCAAASGSRRTLGLSPSAPMRECGPRQGIARLVYGRSPAACSPARPCASSLLSCCGRALARAFSACLFLSRCASGCYIGHLAFDQSAGTCCLCCPVQALRDVRVGEQGEEHGACVQASCAA